MRIRNEASLERQLIDSIYITNFRRIREADITLHEGLTILTGDNGTGKSTVVEAITFNLYGKTKSGAKKDSIRRYGASDSERTFTSIDFTIQDKHYRCNRWLTASMSTSATLYEYTDEEYEKILQGKDRETTDKGIGRSVATSSTGVTSAISDILGVSYDGFCASFIAKQKELDSLASLTTDNRKKFFLDLLGYSRLDTIKPEISREERDREKQIEILQRQGIDVKVSRDEIEKLEAEIKKTTARISDGQRYIKDAETESKRLAERSNACSQAAAIVEQVTKELDIMKRSAQAHRQRIAALETSIEDNRKKSAGWDESVDFTSQRDALADEDRKAREYKAQHDQLEVSDGKVTEMRKHVRQLEEELAAIEKRTKSEPDLDAVIKRVNEVTSELSVNDADQKRLKASIKSLRALISGVESGETAKCPTCGNDVSTEAGMEHLRTELGSTQSELDELVAKGGELSAALDAANAEKAQVNAAIRTYNTDCRRKSQLSTMIEQERATIETTEQSAQQMRQYVTEHASDARTPDEMVRISFAIDDIKRKMESEKAMREAYFTAKSDEAEKVSLSRQVEQEDAQIAEKQQVIAANSTIAQEYEDVRKQQAKCDGQLMRYRSAVESLVQQRAVSETNLKNERDRLERGVQQQNDLITLTDEREAYTGAKAVVEFLREKLPSQIAPKLSERASELLDIATGGTYNLLEIDDEYSVSVYTETTVQPLALMSGGEQDVISLCIRIAIAEMILETSGVDQQTFILDEIFGALDDERKATTCEALRNLGQSLSKILCITHVEEIKDMADWTYVVEKDENGVSTVRELVKQTM